MVQPYMQFFKKLLSSLLLGANVVVILLLWGCCLSTYVSSELLPHLSLLALGFPFFLFANLAFVVVWPLLKARLVWVPMVGLLAASGYIMDYCPLRPAGSVPTDSCLVVVSYNVGQMPSDTEYAGLVQYIDSTDADVWCLQEAPPQLLRRKDFQQMTQRKGYHTRTSKSRVIISRLPFVGPVDTLHYDSRTGSNGTMVCRLEYGTDTLIVLNNHLESYALSLEDKTDYKDALRRPHPTHTSHTGLMLLRKMARAARCRGAQIDSVCAYVRLHRHKPLVVCGDFNATPISYTYQQLSRHLSCAWRQAGSGMGISYNQVGFFVRIDHLFHSSHWVCRHIQIHKRQLSDHYPIISYLSPHPQQPIPLTQGTK